MVRLINYYEVLQVVDFAEIEVINASYRALSKKYHPDINKTEPADTMVKINAAYEILSNPEHKKEYDYQLECFLNSNKKNPVKDEFKVEKENITKKEKFYASYDKKDKKSSFLRALSLTIRIPISIIVAFIIGTIGSYLIMLILDYDSSWLYFLYVILGSFIGGLIGKISECDNSTLSIIGAVITIAVMILPHSLYLYESFYSNYESMGLFTAFAIKEIWWYFMQNGFLRAIFTILAPIAAAGAIEGNY